MTDADNDTGPLRHSPLHERLAACGARFGADAGWSRPTDFGDSAAEHRAASAGVALFDRSGVTQLLVQGPDAESLLQRLCGTDPAAVASGSVVMAAPVDAAVDERAVHRLAANAFLIVTDAGRAADERSRIEREAAPDALVFADDLSGGQTLLELVGPRAAGLLREVGPNDLSDRAFPSGAWRMIEVGRAPVRAARMDDRGIARYQLAMPSDHAVGVFDALVETGASFDLTLAGTRAWAAWRAGDR